MQPSNRSAHERNTRTRYLSLTKHFILGFFLLSNLSPSAMRVAGKRHKPFIHTYVYVVAYVVVQRTEKLSMRL